MDGDIGSVLQSVLSDPEQMAKITQIAQGLMGGQTSGGGLPAPPPEQPAGAAPGGGEPFGAGAAAFSPGDTKLLSALSRAFSSGGEKSRSTALLVAMRPYMKPEKQEKLDRAMKLAQMARIAGVVMQEYGGGRGNGV